MEDNKQELFITKEEIENAINFADDLGQYAGDELAVKIKFLKASIIKCEKELSKRETEYENKVENQKAYIGRLEKREEAQEIFFKTIDIFLKRKKELSAHIKNRETSNKDFKEYYLSLFRDVSALKNVVNSFIKFAEKEKEMSEERVAFLDLLKQIDKKTEQVFENKQKRNTTAKGFQVRFDKSLSGLMSIVDKIKKSETKQKLYFQEKKENIKQVSTKGVDSSKNKLERLKDKTKKAIEKESNNNNNNKPEDTHSRTRRTMVKSDYKKILSNNGFEGSDPQIKKLENVYLKCVNRLSNVLSGKTNDIGLISDLAIEASVELMKKKTTISVSAVKQAIDSILQKFEFNTTKALGSKEITVTVPKNQSAEQTKYKTIDQQKKEQKKQEAEAKEREKRTKIAINNIVEQEERKMSRKQKDAASKKERNKVKNTVLTNPTVVEHVLIRIGGNHYRLNAQDATVGDNGKYFVNVNGKLEEFNPNKHKQFILDSSSSMWKPKDKFFEETHPYNTKIAKEFFKVVNSDKYQKLSLDERAKKLDELEETLRRKQIYKSQMSLRNYVLTPSFSRSVNTMNAGLFGTTAHALEELTIKLRKYGVISKDETVENYIDYGAKTIIGSLAPLREKMEVLATREQEPDADAYEDYSNKISAVESALTEIRKSSKFKNEYNEHKALLDEYQKKERAFLLKQEIDEFNKDDQEVYKDLKKSIAKENKKFDSFLTSMIEESLSKKYDESFTKSAIKEYKGTSNGVNRKKPSEFVKYKKPKEYYEINEIINELEETSYKYSGYSGGKNPIVGARQSSKKTEALLKSEGIEVTGSEVDTAVRLDLSKVVGMMLKQGTISKKQAKALLKGSETKAPLLREGKFYEFGGQSDIEGLIDGKMVSVDMKFRRNINIEEIIPQLLGQAYMQYARKVAGIDPKKIDELNAKIIKENREIAKRNEEHRKKGEPEEQFKKKYLRPTWDQVGHRYIAQMATSANQASNLWKIKLPSEIEISQALVKYLLGDENAIINLAHNVSPLVRKAFYIEKEGDEQGSGQIVVSTQGVAPDENPYKRGRNGALSATSNLGAKKEYSLGSFNFKKIAPKWDSNWEKRIQMMIDAGESYDEIEKVISSVGIQVQTKDGSRYATETKELDEYKEFLTKVSEKFPMILTKSDVDFYANNRVELVKSKLNFYYIQSFKNSIGLGANDHLNLDSGQKEALAYFIKKHPIKNVDDVETVVAKYNQSIYDFIKQEPRKNGYWYYTKDNLLADKKLIGIEGGFAWHEGERRDPERDPFPYYQPSEMQEPRTSRFIPNGNRAADELSIKISEIEQFKKGLDALRPDGKITDYDEFEKYITFHTKKFGHFLRDGVKIKEIEQFRKIYDIYIEQEGSKFLKYDQSDNRFKLLNDLKFLKKINGKTIIDLDKLNDYIDSNVGEFGEYLDDKVFKKKKLESIEFEQDKLDEKNSKLAYLNKHPQVGARLEAIMETQYSKQEGYSEHEKVLQQIQNSKILEQLEYFGTDAWRSALVLKPEIYSVSVQRLHILRDFEKQMSVAMREDPMHSSTYEDYYNKINKARVMLEKDFQFANDVKSGYELGLELYNFLHPDEGEGSKDQQAFIESNNIGNVKKLVAVVLSDLNRKALSEKDVEDRRGWMYRIYQIAKRYKKLQDKNKEAFDFRNANKDYFKDLNRDLFAGRDYGKYSFADPTDISIYTLRRSPADLNLRFSEAERHLPEEYVGDFRAKRKEVYENLKKLLTENVLPNEFFKSNIIKDLEDLRAKSKIYFGTYLNDKENANIDKSIALMEELYNLRAANPRNGIFDTLSIFGSNYGSYDFEKNDNVLNKVSNPFQYLSTLSDDDKEKFFDHYLELVKEGLEDYTYKYERSGILEKDTNREEGVVMSPTERQAYNVERDLLRNDPTYMKEFVGRLISLIKRDTVSYEINNILLEGGPSALIERLKKMKAVEMSPTSSVGHYYDEEENSQIEAVDVDSQEWLAGINGVDSDTADTISNYIHNITKFIAYTQIREYFLNNENGKTLNALYYSNISQFREEIVKDSFISNVCKKFEIDVGKVTPESVISYLNSSDGKQAKKNLEGMQTAGSGANHFDYKVEKNLKEAAWFDLFDKNPEAVREYMLGGEGNAEEVLELLLNGEQIKDQKVFDKIITALYKYATKEQRQHLHSVLQTFFDEKYKDSNESNPYVLFYEGNKTVAGYEVENAYNSNKTMTGNDLTAGEGVCFVTGHFMKNGIPSKIAYTYLYYGSKSDLRVGDEVIGNKSGDKFKIVSVSDSVAYNEKLKEAIDRGITFNNLFNLDDVTRLSSSNAGDLIKKESIYRGSTYRIKQKRRGYHVDTTDNNNGGIPENVVKAIEGLTNKVSNLVDAINKNDVPTGKPAIQTDTGMALAPETNAVKKYNDLMREASSIDQIVAMAEAANIKSNSVENQRKFSEGLKIQAKEIYNGMSAVEKEQVDRKNAFQEFEDKVQKKRKEDIENARKLTEEDEKRFEAAKKYWELQQKIAEEQKKLVFATDRKAIEIRSNIDFLTAQAEILGKPDARKFHSDAYRGENGTYTRMRSEYESEIRKANSETESLKKLKEEEDRKADADKKATEEGRKKKENEAEVLRLLRQELEVKLEIARIDAKIASRSTSSEEEEVLKKRQSYLRGYLKDNAGKYSAFAKKNGINVDDNFVIQGMIEKNSYQVELQGATKDKRDLATWERAKRDENASTLTILDAERKRVLTHNKLEIESLNKIIELESVRLNLARNRVKEAEKNVRFETEEEKLVRQEVDADFSAKKAQILGKDGGVAKFIDKFKNELKRSFSNFLYFNIVSRGVNSLTNSITKVISLTKQLDSSFTNIRVVTGQTEDQTRSLMKAYAGMASELGSTVQEIAKSGNEWMRQGYSIDATEKLIKASTYSATLGMTDQATATKNLTSMLKGFKLEATDAMSIVDKLSALDMQYAASQSQIAEALARTSSVARQAKMSLEESAAAVTVIMDTSQQSAETVGTALRSMLARFGNVSASSFTGEEGEDTEGINDIERVAKAVGVNIRSSKSDMRSYTDVIDDLSKKWATLNDIQKNAVATVFAGTRQRNSFQIMVEGWEEVKKAEEIALNAEGTASEKYQAYMDSVTYATKQLASAWEELTVKLNKSDLLKTVSGGLAGIIKHLDSILTVAGRLASINFAPKFVSNLGLGKGSEGTGLGVKGILGRYKNKITDKFGAAGYDRKIANAGTRTESLLSTLSTDVGAIRNKIVGGGATNVPDDAQETHISNGNAGSSTNIGIATKKQIKDKEKEIKDKENEIDSLVEFGLDDKYASELKEEAAEQNAKELAEMNSQMHAQRVARAKAGALAGIGSAATTFATGSLGMAGSILEQTLTPDSANISLGTGDKAAMAVVSGIGTGIGTAIGGPIGGMIGGAVADGLNLLGKNLIHAEEISRAQRVEQAKEQVEALGKYSDKIESALEDAVKSVSEYTSDDWKAFEDFKDSMEELILDDSIGDEFSESVGKLVKSLDPNNANYAESVAKINAAQIKLLAEATYAQGEEDRAEIRTKLAGAKSDLAKENRKSKEDRDYDAIHSLEATIKRLNNSLEKYTDALMESYMEAAVSTMYGAATSLSLAGFNLDAVVLDIAKEWAKNNPDIFVNNQLTTSAYNDIVSYLRSSGGYDVLFKNTSRSFNMIDKASKNSDYTGTISQAKADFVSGNMTFEELNKILNSDASELQDIAEGFAMTVDGMRSLGSVTDMVTSQDVLDGIDKWTEKMKGLTEVLSSGLGGFSFEDMNKIISNYSWALFDEDGVFNPENVSNRLFDAITGGVSDLTNGKLFKTALTDQNYWNIYLRTLKEEELEVLSGYTTFDSAHSAGKVSDEDMGTFEKMVLQLSGDDNAKAYMELASQYASAYYDKEIESLNSIKDSMEQVNKLREKELNLMKAKIALENASKEKKRVYRAGVGYTYVSDEEAIKKAQEEVDKLEREKAQEDVQYQIDLLTQQKEILTGIEENDKTQDILDLFNKSIGTGGVFATIASNIARLSSKETGSADYTSSELENKQTDISGKLDTLEGIKEKLIEARSAVESAQESGDINSYNEAVKNYSNYITQYSEAKNSLSGYNLSGNNLSRYSVATQYDVSAEELKGMSPTGIGKHKVDLSSWQEDDFSTNIGEIIYEIPIGADKSAFMSFGGTELATADQFSDPDDTWVGTWVNGKVEWTKLDKDEMADLTDENGNKLDPKSPNNIAKYLKQKGKSDYTLVSNTGGADYYAFMKNGNLYWATMHSTISGNERQGKSYEYNTIRGQSGIHIQNPVQAYAFGTLGTSPALINEYGTEAIITPAGTVTALPSKSGIVPADITKNLWALGEVAPNLVARFSGTNLTGSDNSKTEDNSINIDSLNATFNTTSDFDGKKFLSDLKSEIRLTKNSH